MGHRLNRCININDLRRHAHRMLPSPVLGYLEGGADDEVTLARNIAAYSAVDLLPSVLADVSKIDLTTRVLGSTLSIPIMLAPTGMSRLFHEDAELAVARAAAKFNTLYTLSTVATETIESVAHVSAGPKMFQVYVLKDFGLNSEFIQRARAAGYTSLCLTVDVPVGGNRERDLQTGMALPPKFTWESKLSLAMHPSWSLSRLFGKPFDLPNVSQHVAGNHARLAERMNYIFSQFDPSVSWQDAEKMIAEWGGPFAIKGILNADDARKAEAIGATAVIVSNHGGRQLDNSPATFDCLTNIVDAVGDRMEIIIDGGIRRGTDALKAIALGANACMIGRPYLYGLTVGGQAGVERTLNIFKSELERNLALLGCAKISDLNGQFIQHRAWR